MFNYLKKISILFVLLTVIVNSCIHDNDEPENAAGVGTLVIGNSSYTPSYGYIASTIYSDDKTEFVITFTDASSAKELLEGFYNLEITLCIILPGSTLQSGTYSGDPSHQDNLVEAFVRLRNSEGDVKWSITDSYTGSITISEKTDEYEISYTFLAQKDGDGTSAETITGSFIGPVNFMDEVPENNSSIPVLSTSDVADITSTTAKSGGNITSDGGTAITVSGVCWSSIQTPTISDNKTTDGPGSGSFTSTITGLSANTTYYVRAYATNDKGTAYGNEVSFITSQNEGPVTVTDVDGNTYQTITLGTQTWMAENLKTTKYRDGTDIPIVTDNAEWSALTTGACSDYDNTPANSEIYGKLYNWYAVTDNHKLAPEGWHIPTDAEWTALQAYLINNGYCIEGLGGDPYAKSLASTTNWVFSTRIGAVGNTDYPEYRNKTAFTALPGGYLDKAGVFNRIGLIGFWWSVTERITDDRYAWGASILNDEVNLNRTYQSKNMGFSIRCIKD